MKLIMTRLLASLALLVPAVGLAQMYAGPESVEYHPRLNRHLVSNTSGGAILARAADGTLSVFTDDPAASYGIELLAGTLFVLDSGHVKGFDIDSAAPVMDLALTGAAFLNGITSNGVDTLYVSDFSGKKIYTVHVGDLAAPTQDTPVSTGTATPNGMVYDRVANRLLIATWGANAKVLSLDLVMPGATPVALINTTLGNIDGIALDCTGAIVVAPWSGCGVGGGCLRRFDPPFTLTSPPLVVTNALSNPADIDYNVVSGQIAVPESGANRVTLVDTTCPGSLFYSDFER